jgi:hypothetical protein
LLLEYKKKIGIDIYNLAEKRENLKCLESEAHSHEQATKKVYDSCIENENKIKKLQQELYEFTTNKEIKVDLSSRDKTNIIKNETNELDPLRNVHSICMYSQMTEYDYIENDEKPFNINENLSYLN